MTTGVCRHAFINLVCCCASIAQLCNWRLLQSNFLLFCKHSMKHKPFILSSHILCFHLHSVIQLLWLLQECWVPQLANSCLMLSFHCLNLSLLLLKIIQPLILISSPILLFVLGLHSWLWLSGKRTNYFQFLSQKHSVEDYQRLPVDYCKS